MVGTLVGASGRQTRLLLGGVYAGHYGNWHSRQTRLSAKFTRPSPATTLSEAMCVHDRPGIDGLVARLVQRNYFAHQCLHSCWSLYPKVLHSLEHVHQPLCLHPFNNVV